MGDGTNSGDDGACLRVQKRQCATCIYHPGSPLELELLEAEVRDEHLGFRAHRICHHSADAVCRGFWNRHKDAFALGQIAQRLGLVAFVDDDTLNRRGDFDE